MRPTQEEYDALEDAHLRAQRLATRQAERAERADTRLAEAERLLRMGHGARGEEDFADGCSICEYLSSAGGRVSGQTPEKGRPEVAQPLAKGAVASTPASAANPSGPDRRASEDTLVGGPPDAFRRHRSAENQECGT